MNGVRHRKFGIDRNLGIRVGQRLKLEIRKPGNQKCWKNGKVENRIIGKVEQWKTGLKTQ
jgi:hypothetical protein